MDKAQVQVPDYTAPLLGVRKWQVENGKLNGLFKRGEWARGGEQKAKCDEHDSPPAVNCSCGLYAFYDYDLYSQHCGELNGVEQILGIISARGDIVLAQYGFRAEYMKIEAFLLNKLSISVFGSEVSIAVAYEAMAKRYGVPLLDPQEVPSFCEELGGVVLGEHEKPPGSDSDSAWTIVAGAVTVSKLAAGSIVGGGPSGIRLPTLPDTNYPEGTVLVEGLYNGLYRSTGVAWVQILAKSSVTKDWVAFQLGSGKDAKKRSSMKPVLPANTTSLTKMDYFCQGGWLVSALLNVLAFLVGLGALSLWCSQ